MLALPGAEQKKIESLEHPLSKKAVMSDRELCSWCNLEMDEPYWQNLVKSFCSLECTNEYLRGEGFKPIEGPSQSSPGLLDDLRCPIDPDRLREAKELLRNQ